MLVSLVPIADRRTIAWIAFAACCITVWRFAGATEPADGQPRYLLRYKFHAGQTLRWQVEHLATTETTIRNVTQSSKSRSLSIKAWRVLQVDQQGNATYEHSVEQADMWQKVSDRPEVRYNSQTDAEPPLLYENVARTVGRPLYRIRVSPRGHVLERRVLCEGVQEFQLGFEQVIVLLPEHPVAVGDSWHHNAQVSIRLADGRVKRFTVRRVYRLEKVQTGVATIEVKTQVLTPFDNPQEQLDLMQRLNDGYIKFDIDAGRVLFKRLDWDETVVNFNGPQSCLEYLARFTEEFLSEEPTSNETDSTAAPRTANRPRPAAPSRRHTKRTTDPRNQVFPRGTGCRRSGGHCVSSRSAPPPI